jgi:micrococcal nuclease
MGGGRLRIVLAAAVVAVGASCSRGGPAGGTGGGGAGVPAVVTRVIDGDTVHAVVQGRDERVRFIGVDTPEIGSNGGHAECFGAEAGAYTRDRLESTTVRLRFDVARRDRYGRLLAYVYRGPELFNLTLVARGYARDDPVPPDVAMAAAFASAERAARQGNRGLWGRCPGGGSGQ